MPFEAESTPPSPTRPAPAPRQLSGRAVVVYIGLFFGSIICANAALVYSALRTLSGGPLANAYDASQTYNKSIASARVQNERGWRAEITTRAEADGARVAFILRDRDGAPVGEAQVEARFEHPFDRRADRTASLAQAGATYEGLVRDVHPGRWTLVIEATAAGESVYVTRNRLSLELAANAGEQR